MTVQHIRLLVVDDSEDDARLLHCELIQSGIKITYFRVDCAEDMRVALLDSEWDIIVSDHAMPQFSSLEALNLLRESGKDIPFIIYSGAVSEHVAIAALCSGAQDSIPKGNFARLFPAIEREIHSAVARRAREQANAYVHKLAFYDSLTGLPNTNMFCNYLAGRVQAQGNCVAIFMVKIDRLLRINNCRGHKTGEALVCQIAQRLQDCVSGDGMVARSGRDEFLLFLGHAYSEELVRVGADDIRQALSRPFVEGACDYQFTASIGISMAPCDGDDVSALLIYAETAMLRAQDLGGDNCQFYVPEIASAACDQLMLESFLHKAISRQELFIEYQPNLNSETKVVTGLQAQVRWKHPILGLLQSDQFIPLASESSLIADIGAWVMHNACRQVQAWSQAGHTELTIAVRVSTVQFLRPDLLQTVARVLKETGIAPNCLELEITETTLTRYPETTTLTLQALKNMGVSIAVCGFRTGHSFLDHLRRFPIDILRIDELLCAFVTRDAKGATIMRSVVALARDQGLTIVAEGVETVEQFNFLRLQGCARVQGVLFSPPRSVADITEMLGARLAGRSLPRSRLIAAEQCQDIRVGQIPTRGFAGLAA